MPPYILIPILAAVFYCIGSLFNKQAMAAGCGQFRITALNAWVPALTLLPAFFFYSDPMPLHLWYQPLTAAACFYMGSLFFILALRTGDLSIVAPVAGAKPIMNALLVSSLLGVTVPFSTWIAAGLTLIALTVLRSPNKTTSHSFLRTVLVTMSSSLSFALCDTCFQHWAGGWGVMRFGALTFLIAAIACLGMIPHFSTPWKKLSKAARTHTAAGAFFCMLPALCMAFTLGRYGHAPEVNVAYSSRAVISIVAVRLLSRWIGSTEHHISRAVLIRRLVGTAILTSAVALVIFGSAS
ncbi:MAG: hypothetical protein ISR84_05975 [Kiritimatiellales bacterium]|nr:hypothetical protein [Kiritimatiellales bacterium]